MQSTSLYTVNKYKIALNIDNYKKSVQADGVTAFARGYSAS